MVDVSVIQFVIAMNVAIQHGDIFIRCEGVHHVIAVAREPFPVGLQVEERAVGEDDDGSGAWKSRQVIAQPAKLFRADLGLGARNVVEPDEVYAAVVKRIMCFAEVLAKQYAAIKPGVVLAGNKPQLGRLDSACNLPELGHARGVYIFVLGIVCEVAGEKHEFGCLRQPVDDFNRSLERCGARGIRRSVEADMRIAELDKGERRHGFAIAPAHICEEAAQRAVRTKSGYDSVECSDSQREAGELHESTTIDLFH